MQNNTKVSNILKKFKWYHLDLRRLTIIFLLQVEVASEVKQNLI